MTKNKDWFGVDSGGPGILPWREVKNRLSGRTDKELISLLGECYRLSADNRVRLSLAVSDGHEETGKVIENLQTQLRNAFWATGRGGRPREPDLKRARHVISLAKKSTDDQQAILDLMFDYVSHAVGFTAEYGEMWDSYYSSIDGMFEKVCKHIVKHRSKIDIENAFERIDECIEMCGRFGYGVQDNMEYLKDELEGELGR